MNPKHRQSHGMQGHSKDDTVMKQEQITLSKFFGKPEHPEDKWGIGCIHGETISENVKQFKTKSLLYAYSTLSENLASIASERALSSKWKIHPMAGIFGGKDKVAKHYTRTKISMDKILDELLSRDLDIKALATENVK